jgi:DNA-binding transcriptional MerR regulator
MVGFTANQAAQLASVSVDTLDNWVRARFLIPSVQHEHRRGAPRRYSFRDIVALRVAATLRARGVGMRDLRRVVTYLRKRSGLSVTESLAQSMLVTDGRDVYEVTYDVDRDGNRMLTSTLRAPGQGAFCIVEFSDVVNAIQREARALAASKAA